MISKKAIEVVENWNLNNDNVLILAGDWAENIALKYKIYECQNHRTFSKGCKYMAFYNNGFINYLFEITHKPFDFGTQLNTPEMQSIKKDMPEYDADSLRRVFKLKKIADIKPIKNDSISKSGKNCPFTYGQPRYTTYDRIIRAKVTSELITGIKEDQIILKEPGTNTLINPNGASIRLQWRSNDDFDIAVAYEDKKGTKGLVYFSNKGSLISFPFMQLDKDSRSSLFGLFRQKETIIIGNLDQMNKVYIICWDWEAEENKMANFDNCKVEVSIEDENGFESIACLKIEGNYNATCIAKIEQEKDGFAFSNISKGFAKSGNIDEIFKRIEN